MVTVLGGMLLRMAVATIVIVLILLLLPIDPLVFTGTFFGLFVVALVLEVLFLHKRTDKTATTR
jgi:hypothetical protein